MASSRRSFFHRAAALVATPFAAPLVPPVPHFTLRTQTVTLTAFDDDLTALFKARARAEMLEMERYLDASMDWYKA